MGHTGKDRDFHSNIEDTANIDNECRNGSETMLALRGSEVDSYLSDLLPNREADLNILTKEIHSLWQHVGAGEGQPAEGLDHIDHLEWELQTLSLTLSTQPSSTPTPIEPFGEVVCQYMDTL